MGLCRLPLGGDGYGRREGQREGACMVRLLSCGWDVVLMACERAGRASSSRLVVTAIHTPTGHMNSQQPLPRVHQNEPTDAEPTNADDFHSSVVREIEPPSGPRTP